MKHGTVATAFYSINVCITCACLPSATVQEATSSSVEHPSSLLLIRHRCKELSVHSVINRPYNNIINLLSADSTFADGIVEFNVPLDTV